jgi:hypothetical protein
MHITTPISNPSNIYSVERIHDDNVNDTNQIQITPSGSQYYTLKIIPNDYTQLLCAGNFTIDSLSSSWVYNATMHPLHPSKCYPQNPPWYGSSVGQSLKHSTPHSYILKGDGSQMTQGGTPCWGPGSQTGQNFTGNGTYRFNGPFVFDNSAYCDGAFRNQFVEVVTWRKIILVDVYENDDGTLRDGASGGLDNTDNWIQMIWPPPVDQYTNLPDYTLNPNHNGYPVHIKAFVFPEYHPELDLEENMNLNLDIDYVLPVQGCTDASANNYDSLANTNDGSCTYGSQALFFPPITVSSDITSANHTLYEAMQFNGGNIMQNPLSVLVLEDIVFDIPMPTLGTPPYFDYEIQLLNDTVTVNGSPSGSGSIPAEILLVNDFLSTINGTNPLLYDDMHTMDFTSQSPPGPNFPIELDTVGFEPGDGVNTFNAGSLTLNKVILSVPGTPSSSYSVHDITLEVSAKDSNGDTVTSSVSVDIAAELGI